MPFYRDEEKKGLSLPGLIDIIFLLLIFSLVTLSVSQATIESESQGNTDIDFNLPRTQTKDTEEAGVILNTLLFEIDYQDRDDPESGKIVYVLKPSLKDSLTIDEARQIAIQDSTFAVYPKKFLVLTDREFAAIDPCRLIKRELHHYKEIFFYEPRLSNSIEIRAVKDTEFRIINYILERCSSYGDTIPRIVVRTLGGKGVQFGI